MTEYGRRWRARGSRPHGAPDKPAQPVPVAEPTAEVEPEAAPWTAWHDVEQRLDELADAPRQTLTDFVDEVLEATRAPVVVTALARHPGSAATVRAWLRDLVSGEPAELRARVAFGETFAAAMSAAARLLLPPEEAQAAVEAVEAHLSRMSSHYFQFLDASAGHRPAGAASTPGASVRHRLIIAEQLDDPRMVALLLPGCERATVLSTADLFGRADFADRAAWTGSGEVRIEHIRSRITRYSPEYIGLHLATVALAERLTCEIAGIPGLLHPDDRPFLALDVADFLFFRALRVHALELLLDDPDFDDVVVAVGEQSPASEFLRLLAGVDRIRTDPRVQIVSVGRTTSLRVAFWQVLDTIASPLVLQEPLALRYSMDTVVRRFAALAAARVVDVAPPDEPWVLLGTASKDAYIESTVTCAREIARDRPVRVLHMQNGATPADPALTALGNENGIRFSTCASDAVPGNPMVDAIRRFLQPRCARTLAAADTRFEHAAARALTVSLAPLCSGVVVPALLRAKVLEHGFASWRGQSRLPAAVVLIPQRPGDIGAIAAAARRTGVPSIAVEPHLYVPEYSRYTKVVTDYYGVLSTHLVEGAVKEFGLGDPERVRVIGSPRLVAPHGYDPAEAQRLARTAYTAEHGFDFSRAPTHLVFFCQPSGWKHVEPVWDLLLDAVEKSGTHLFYKVHPEEGPARIQQYENRAARRGLSRSVTRLGGDAADAVALADIAATSYSTAALDAAIRAKPVVGVAPGGRSYPVEVAAIAGARVATTADELAAYLDEFAVDPTPMQRDARAWLEREHQFVDGPGAALRQFVADVIERGTAGIRTPEQLPESLFTDGPHPVFQV